MRKITAIVCTRNRANLLARALESLCAQSLPPWQYAVIVADNASTDDTAGVARRFAAVHDNIEYLSIENVGSSAARNAALGRARSDYVAYLDDDAVADVHWLSELVGAFESVTPSPICIGGRIRPLWEAPKPAWFPDKYVPSLSVLDLGDAGRYLTEREYAVGANIAYQRAALLQVGGYEERLKLYMDEVYVQMKLRHRGYPIYYHSGAVVHHLIPRARLTREYLRRRKYLGGRGELIVRQLGKGGWAGYRTAVVNAVGRPAVMTYLALGWLWHELARDDSRSLDSQALLWRSAGIFVEALRSIAGRNGLYA